MFWKNPEAREKQEKKKAWFAAANKADKEAVEAFLREGWPVDTRDGQGRTALCHALLRMDRAMVLFLKENGADPSVRDAEGNPVLLHWARRCDSFHNRGADGTLFLDFLLDKGFDPHARGDGGCTLLHVIADKRGSWISGAVSLFRERNLDPFVLDDKGLTPLDRQVSGDYRPLREFWGEYQKAFMEKQEHGEETALPGESWHRTGLSEITHVSVLPEAGYRMTEVFNFAAGTYTRIAQNLATQAESQALMEMARFVDAAPLEAALTALESRGGSAPAQALPPALLKRRKVPHVE